MLELLALGRVLARQHRPQVADVLARLAQRLVDRLSVPRLHHRPVRDPEADHGTPVRELVQGGERLGGGHRRARVDRHHAGAQADAVGARGVGHQRGHGVARRDMRHEGGLVAELLGPLGALDRRLERASGADERAQSHGARKPTAARATTYCRHRAALMSAGDIKSGPLRRLGSSCDRRGACGRGRPEARAGLEAGGAPGRTTADRVPLGRSRRCLRAAGRGLQACHPAPRAPVCGALGGAGPATPPAHRDRARARDGRRTRARLRGGHAVRDRRCLPNTAAGRGRLARRGGNRGGRAAADVRSLCAGGPRRATGGAAGYPAYEPRSRRSNPRAWRCRRPWYAASTPRRSLPRRRRSWRRVRPEARFGICGGFEHLRQILDRPESSSALRQQEPGARAIVLI